MIKIDSVSKSYGTTVVVDKVSIDLPKGEIISLIGPNGAGKSTLLGMMSRLLKKDSGDIKINDLSLADWDTTALSKELAIMKQSEHINVKIRVKDLVAFGRFPYNQGHMTSTDEKIVDEALSFLDLTDMKNAYIDELSGGQRQRAYIASIYAQDTDYILLDEPLNNLDIKHSANMLKLLKEMATLRNKTIIIVIHDINFAVSFSDRIVLMDKGKIVTNGTVDEVITSENLESIYGMPFEIATVKGKKFCMYYQ